MHKSSSSLSMQCPEEQPFPLIPAVPRAYQEQMAPDMNSAGHVSHSWVQDEPDPRPCWDTITLQGAGQEGLQGQREAGLLELS